MPEALKQINETLASDHAELGGLLDEVFAALEAGDPGASFSKLDLFWARLAMHIRAEHLHLFPQALFAVERREKTAQSRGEQSEIPPETAHDVVETLREDHDLFMRELADVVKQLREWRGQALTPEERAARLSAARDQITEVSRRLEWHNQMEEAEVYRWADALLTAPERADLRARIQKELDNLPPRFGGN